MSITIAKHQKTTIVLSLLLAFTCVLLLHSKVSAATINVSTGTDTVEDDSICQLSEAITNINNQDTTYEDCVPTGSYGDNDTINIPTGTITLTNHLPGITASLTVQGQGMGQSIVDGEQLYRGFGSANNLLEITISNLTIKDYREYAIQIENSNTILSGLEITGNPATESQFYGIFIQNDGNGQDLTTELSDIYIHDMEINASSRVHIIAVGNSEGGTTHDVNIDNVTISDVNNTTGSINTVILGNGFFGNTTGHFNATVNNLTLSNITGQGTVNGLVGGAMMIEGSGSSTANYDVSNITIKGMRSNTSVYGAGSIIALSTAAVDAGANAVASMLLSNALLADNMISVGFGCTAVDYGLFFGSPEGVSTPSLTSSGGNLSDDSSCNDYFTHPTDQTELSNLSDSLGSLSGNGGLIPTIPLLAGSPAIDAGVAVEGLTTDARGVSRPQCAAYDSGAYEYNGDCPEPQTDTTTLTTPLPNATTSYLVLPSGVSNASFSTTDSTTVPTDTGYTFPSSLVSFQFDTTPGNTETIVLYFDLPGDPSSYTARKYDTNNHSFSTIPNATVTRETYNNQSLIKLTYNITDGDNLDQDHTINGTIIDPVGLGTQTTTTPNTGLAQYWLLGLRG